MGRRCSRPTIPYTTASTRYRFADAIGRLAEQAGLAFSLLVIGRCEFLYIEAKFGGCVLSAGATMGNSDIHVAVPAEMNKPILGLETAPKSISENPVKDLRQLF